MFGSFMCLTNKCKALCVSYGVIYVLYRDNAECRMLRRTYEYGYVNSVLIRDQKKGCIKALYQAVFIKQHVFAFRI